MCLRAAVLYTYCGDAKRRYTTARLYQNYTRVAASDAAVVHSKTVNSGRPKSTWDRSGKDERQSSTLPQLTHANASSSSLYRFTDRTLTPIRRIGALSRVPSQPKRARRLIRIRLAKTYSSYSGRGVPGGGYSVTMYPEDGTGQEGIRSASADTDSATRNDR